MSLDVADRLGIVEWFRIGEHDRVEAAIRRLQTLGIRHFRTHVSWADYHGEGGHAWYHWLLARLGTAFDLLPCLHYTPPNLSETGRSSGPPRRLKDFPDFVDMVIDRHGQHFSSVELWNEPNNLLDWDWRVDIGWHKFSEMIGAAGYWARQCGKQAVLGGPCPTDANWLALMGERGVLGVFDVIGVHGFPGTWDSIDGGIWPGWAAVLQAVRETASAFNPQLQFWITETGYSTWRHDVANQARAFLAAVQAPAERLYWYALQDLEPSMAVQEGRYFDVRHYHFGLDDSSGRPKLLSRLLQKGVPEVARTVELEATLPRPALVGTRPVVVTGGAGFIGTNLAERLASERHHVLVFDALARPGVEENLHWLTRRNRRRISVAIADLRDTQALSDTVADAQAVFHLAGQVAVTTSMATPTDDFDINARSTLRVLDLLRTKNPGAPLIFASTNKVYGDLADIELAAEGDRYLPVDRVIREHGIGEERPLCFHTPYGCSKGAADQYVLDYANSYGLRTVVLRMSCIYGERQLGTEDQGWVAHFLLKALAGEKLTIYGDGRQVRDVLDVGDAVAAYLSAWREVDAVRGRAFNLGGGPANAISLRQLVAYIEDLLGRRIDVSYDAWRPGDQRYFVAATAAARRDLNLSAPLGWRSGIARLAAHFGAPARAASGGEVTTGAVAEAVR